VTSVLNNIAVLKQHVLLQMPSVLAAQDPRPEGDKKLLADKAFCQERHIQLQWCSPRKAVSSQQADAALHSAEQLPE